MVGFPERVEARARYSLERRKHHKNIAGRVLLYAVLGFYSLYVLYPLFWVGVNSLKDNQAFFEQPWSMPVNPRWENYREAWVGGRLGRSFANSMVVTGLSVLSIAFIAPMAGYALARLDFPLKRPLFYLFLSGMFVAPVTGLIPLVKLMRSLGLVDTCWTLILPNIAYGLPLSIFMMRSFFVGIPRSIDDAATAYGLSRWQMYWLIALPMSVPTVNTVAILQTVYIWNEFLFSLVLVRSPERFTMPRALMTFKGTFITAFGPLNAAVILSAVPTIIVYFVFADRIRRGMSMGFSAKG